jgi:hypothetical protein
MLQDMGHRHIADKPRAHPEPFHQKTERECEPYLAEIALHVAHYMSIHKRGIQNIDWESQ